MDYFDKYNSDLSVMEDTEIERVGNEIAILPILPNFNSRIVF